MSPHGAETSPRAVTAHHVRWHLPASTSASAAPATYTEKLRPSEFNHTAACAIAAGSLRPPQESARRRPLPGAGQPCCDLYRIAALLMLIEEIVDQPPVLPLVVSELGSRPAATATHRRRATSTVVRGEHAHGASG
jgi:hypothetical protein